MTETQLQVQVARLLDHTGMLWCHPPNGGKRGIVTASLLKAMGTKSGVPDVLIFEPVRSGPKQRSLDFVGLAIELKVGNNKPTASQLEWHQRLLACGWEVAVCRSIDEVLAVLRRAYPKTFP